MRAVLINLTAEFSRRTGRRHPRHSIPPADLGYCIPVAEKIAGDTVFFDTSVQKKDIQEIVSSARKDDIFVIKPNIFTERPLEILIRGLREKAGVRAIFLMGGMATLYYERYLRKTEAPDAVIKGEPEHGLRILLETVAAGGELDSIPAKVVKLNNGIAVTSEEMAGEELDIDDFSFHRNFLDNRYTFFYPMDITGRFRFSVVLTSRGCPVGCMHCSPVMRVSGGSRYRSRSIENIIKELKCLKKMGADAVYFADDNFTFSKTRVKEICGAIIKNGIDMRWAAQAHANSLFDELLDIMKRAGCRCLNIGIESGNARTQTLLGKHLDLKHTEDVCVSAQKKGIHLSLDFMLGIPGENQSDMLATLSYAARLNPYIMNLLVYTPYSDDGMRTEVFDIRSPYDTRGRAPYYGLRKHLYFRYYCRIGYIKRWIGVFRKNIFQQLRLAGGFIRYYSGI